MKKAKFKDRYVLGTGFPFAIGSGPYHDTIGLWVENLASKRIPLKWPMELWNPSLPKYRLVLERVK